MWIFDLDIRFGIDPLCRISCLGPRCWVLACGCSPVDGRLKIWAFGFQVGGPDSQTLMVSYTVDGLRAGTPRLGSNACRCWENSISVNKQVLASMYCTLKTLSVEFGSGSASLINMKQDKSLLYSSSSWPGATLSPHSTPSVADTVTVCYLDVVLFAL